MKHLGFIPPIIDNTHYVLGGGNLGLTILQEDSNWTSLLPVDEIQLKNSVETANCTAFGTTNSIEILMFKLFGERVNYSDRWLGIVAGTRFPGNDPHTVAEAIRKHGLIPESMLPFSDDIKSEEEYYSFKGANEEECRKAGKEWLAKYDFRHEWVFRPGQSMDEQINNMKVALKSSPLCIALYAWASDNRNVYYSLGQPNHWTTVYNIAQFMEIFDSYSPFRKLVDQNILYCKRYSIVKKLELQEQLNIIEKILLWIQEQINKIKLST